MEFELNQFSDKQVKIVMDLLKENNTIPFIARYKKELTNGLNEEELRFIQKEFMRKENLKQRQNEIIETLNKRELLTSKLEQEINNAKTITELELVYYPYRMKKITKATKAKSKNINLITDLILENKVNFNIQKWFEENKHKFKVVDYAEFYTGIIDIITEQIDENVNFYTKILNNTQKYGDISTKQIGENIIYKIYYEFRQKINYLKSFQILAINRAEKNKIIKVKINGKKEYDFNYLKNNLIKYNMTSEIQEIYEKSIKNALDKYIYPRIERQIRKELTNKANDVAIDIFKNNVEQMLLQKPLEKKIIMGIDPAFVSGIKIVIIDHIGNMIENFVTFPFKNKNESKNIISVKIKKYNIDLIAIGNGTASYETEELINEIINEASLKVKYVIVDERGASVYSASKIAKEEFPNLSVEMRSAISIARRLQDPLSELVKIDPKSIGIGQYQHDLQENHLNESLVFAVSKVVNQVGVNINTATKQILIYIAGLNKKLAENIINYRNENGIFKSREQFKKVKGIGPKTYEQAIGFIRIPESKNFLDNTIIHPMHYKLVQKLLEKKDNLSKEYIYEQIDDKYLANIIIASLIERNFDPRTANDLPKLKSKMENIESIKVGSVIDGVINNILEFGVFVDIGIKSNGLLHISKITKKLNEYKLNSKIKVKIEKINIEENKISLIEVRGEK